jgi:hypothetical protein
VKKRLLAGTTLALAAGSLAAGCGGGSDSSTTSTAALTKSEFLAQGNKICAKGNQEINQAAKKTFSNGQPSAGQVNQFVTQTVIPSIQSSIAGVEALAPPTGDEAQVNAIVTSAQTALDKAKANPKLLTENSSNDPFAESNKLAEAYGLTKCGGGGGG